MTKLFVTSDQHFGHKLFIEKGLRPFSSVEEMDKTLVDRWNSVVSDDDLVYQLGDFTLGDGELARYYFNQLRGKIFVTAYFKHHDRRWLSDWRSFESKTHPITITPSVHTIETPNGLAIILCHFPFEAWDRSHYGSVHFHGHNHKSQMPNPGRRWNVCADLNDYTPIDVYAFLQEKGWTDWHDFKDEGGT